MKDAHNPRNASMGTQTYAHKDAESDALITDGQAQGDAENVENQREWMADRGTMQPGGAE